MPALPSLCSVPPSVQLVTSGGGPVVTPGGGPEVTPEGGPEVTLGGGPDVTLATLTSSLTSGGRESSQSLCTVWHDLVSRLAL